MRVKTTASAFIAMFVAAMASSCATADDEATEPIAPLLDELDEHVGELRSDTEAHSEEILATSEISPIAEIESEHHHMMGAMLEDIEHKLKEMAECHHDDGDIAETSAMVGAVEDALGEMDDHASAMELAGTLADALEEEAVHAEAMTALVDALAAEHTKLAGDTKGMMCPMDEGH